MANNPFPVGSPGAITVALAHLRVAINVHRRENYLSEGNADEAYENNVDAAYVELEKQIAASVTWKVAAPAGTPIDTVDVRALLENVQTLMRLTAPDSNFGQIAGAVAFVELLLQFAESRGDDHATIQRAVNLGGEAARRIHASVIADKMTVAGAKVPT